MGKKPYSYHSFLFPFIWDQDDKIERDEFEKIFEEDSLWGKNRVVRRQ